MTNTPVGPVGMPGRIPGQPRIPRMPGGVNPVRPESPKSESLPNLGNEESFRNREKMEEVAQNPFINPLDPEDAFETVSPEQLEQEELEDEDDLEITLEPVKPAAPIRQAIGTCDSCGKEFYSLADIGLHNDEEVLCLDCTRKRETVQEKNLNPIIEEIKEKIEDVRVENPTKNKIKTDKTGREIFIDEKKKKLLPFGGGKRKVKVVEFDQRNNLRKRALIIQLLALSLIVVTMGFSIKNAFFPPSSLNESDVLSIVSERTGLDVTGYPVENGQAFAENFIKAFVTSEDDNTSERVLNYYYSGSWDNQQTVNSGVSYNGGYKSTVVYGPVTWDAKTLTEYSASYVIGVLVKPVIVDDSGKTVAVPNKLQKEEWRTFNVNVYYDSEKNALSIAPGSPSILPNPIIKSQTDVPDAYSLGTKIQDLDRVGELKSVVLGFMQGYSTSSENSHAAIDQYIISNPPVILLNGLASQYNFAGPTDDAVKFEAFDQDADPNSIKVLVTVNWRDPIIVAPIDGEPIAPPDSAQNSVYAQFTSTYLMTLEKQANGKYLVSKFAPKYYAK